jgi:hypothetical protein
VQCLCDTGHARTGERRSQHSAQQTVVAALQQLSVGMQQYAKEKQAKAAVATPVNDNHSTSSSTSGSGAANVSAAAAARVTTQRSVDVARNDDAWPHSENVPPLRVQSMQSSSSSSSNSSGSEKLSIEPSLLLLMRTRIVKHSYKDNSSSGSSSSGQVV